VPVPDDFVNAQASRFAAQVFAQAETDRAEHGDLGLPPKWFGVNQKTIHVKYDVSHGSHGVMFGNATVSII
jgi:hypothetical protein